MLNWCKLWVARLSLNVVITLLELKVQSVNLSATVLISSRPILLNTNVFPNTMHPIVNLSLLLVIMRSSSGNVVLSNWRRRSQHHLRIGLDLVYRGFKSWGLIVAIAYCIWILLQPLTFTLVASWWNLLLVTATTYEAFTPLCFVILRSLLL